MNLAYVAQWLLACFAVWVAAIPAASALFPRFPDRGAALAPPVGLAVLGLTAYWVGHLAFGTTALVAGLVVLFGTYLACVRGTELRLRRAVEAMAVFLVAFALVALVQAVWPDVSPAGGEQFLNFAVIKSLLRADALPPADPWFAGESVRYYYGGHLLVSLLVELSGVPPAHAFNLALASFYATLVTAAYGLTGALADARGRSARVGGLVGAFCVGLAGTLATPARLLAGALASDEVILGPLKWTLVGVRAGAEGRLAQTTLDGWSMWNARYVVPGTLNEFPLWSYVNGTLHAHMLAPPFALLAAGLCFAYVRTPAAAVRRRRALVFGALPAVAGLVGLVNLWSLPTAVGLAWLTLTFADADPGSLLPSALRDRGDAPTVADGGPTDAPESAAGRVVRELRRTGVAAALTVGVAALAVAWAAPFVVFGSPGNEGVGFLPPRTGFGTFALAHGLFLVPLVLGLLLRWRGTLARAPRWAVAAGALALVGCFAALGLVAHLAVAGVLVALVAAGWATLRTRDAGFEVLLLVAACGILLVVEFAYARVWPFDPNAVRWNTGYKVNVQAFVLLGVAAGVAVTRLVGGSVDALRSRLAGDRSGIDRGRVAAALVCVVLLVAAVTFPAMALAERFESTVKNPESADLSLDGTRYVDQWHPGEAQAIAWLDDRPGQPTIVSKPGLVMYTWVNAPASLTGVQTVAGWKHEQGYRGDEAYRDRVRDVELVYTAPWPTAAAILVKYDVDYVYLGPNEREAYGDRDFAQHPGVSVAYEDEEATIYAVNRTVLRNRTDA